MNMEVLSAYYFQITDLWQKLCEAHHELLNLTFDEYSALLSNELEEIELKVAEKEIIVRKIAALENIRQEIIGSLNAELPDNLKINSVSALLSLMSQYEIESNQKHLFRFNALLIDIIEKLQQQNKKNQLYINKALQSLKEIRLEVQGKKNFSTYTKRGAAVHSTT